MWEKIKKFILLIKTYLPTTLIWQWHFSTDQSKLIFWKSGDWRCGVYNFTSHNHVYILSCKHASQPIRTRVLSWLLYMYIYIFIYLFIYLLHVTREFYSTKLICRNLYAIFSHVKKAYTANQNGIQLFFTCGHITNQRCKGLCKPIKIVDSC